MGARTFQELDVWRLADELRQKVVAVSATGSLSRDRRLCDQLRSAASSAPANLAEGFKRFNPGEFAQFVKYARASLAELGVHLCDARDRGYVTNEQYHELSKLAARTAIAAARLHAYLRSAKPPASRSR